MIEYCIGQKASAKKTITDKDVQDFARISGDYNPVHLDEEYASKTRFGRRIVHGILVSSLISKVIGTDLPGKGTIYLSQNLKFMKPVYIGDEIEAEVEIADWDLKKKRMKLKTIVKRGNECVIEGEALVMPPEKEELQYE